MSPGFLVVLIGAALFSVGFLLGAAVMLRQAWTTLPKEDV